MRASSPSSRSCSTPFGLELVSAGRTRPARARGDRHHLRRERPHQGPCRRRRRPACSRWPTIPASASMRSAASPASTPPTGPDADAAATTPSACGASRTRCRRPAPHRPAERRGSFNATLCLAHPDGRDVLYVGKVDGTLVWPPRGDMGFGFDPVFMPDGYDITFGEMPSDDQALLVRRARSASATAPAPLPNSSTTHWEAALSTELRPQLSRPRGNGLFGVYVHWPFCAAKCPYCDFNSHVHRGEFDEAGLCRGLRARDRAFRASWRRAAPCSRSSSAAARPR